MMDKGADGSQVLWQRHYTNLMIDALIKAGKPYDLLLLPEQTHFFNGTSEKYMNERRVKRHFEENLKHQSPKKIDRISTYIVLLFSNLI